MTLDTPLEPLGEDGILRVVLPGRISTPSQDIKSIDSQQESAEAWLKRNYGGPYEAEHLGEQASGWLVGRESMVYAEELINSGRCDLVLVGEVREVYRNPAMLWGFVHACVDAGVRFISIADAIDTADEEWERAMHVASLLSGMAVPESRRRVRRKATSSFAHGGMVLKVKFGYRKLTREQADSGTFGPAGLCIARVDAHTQSIREMVRRVIRGESYSQISDWLNDEGIPPGDYVEKGRWSRDLVTDLLRDPILSGQRRFRVTKCKLVYKTGKNRPEKNPNPEMKEYPELAHISPEEHKRLLAAMAERPTSSGSSQRSGKGSPLWGRPRKRSPWPGQQVTCGVCGGLMYHYGKYLRCADTLSAGSKRCWNHSQLRIDLVRARVIPWVTEVLEGIPGLREKVVNAAWAEFQRSRDRRHRSGGRLGLRIAELENRSRNLAKAVGHAREIQALVDELREVDTQLKRARLERDRLAANHPEQNARFRSADDVSSALAEALARMAESSLEFADVLRRLIPRFVVKPVQQLDSPQVRLVGHLTLSTGAWSHGGDDEFEVKARLELFEPPQHIQHLRACVEVREANSTATLEELGSILGVNRMTVKRALDYARRMEAEGWTEPYLRLQVKPATASRWVERCPTADRSGGRPDR